MKSRALISFALGSVLLVLLGGGGVRLNAAAPGLECASCHEQAQKIEKSAHAGLTCDTCHDGHEAYPHPANIPKPVCTTCHQDQAGEYANGVHGQARKAGNESAPDCGM